jgi:DNA-binding transcriptional ArsR family regulator
MNSPPIAAVGALVGEPARALMLATLMDGRAYTASELADVAGVTRQTASAHLGRLMEGGLLALARQGRHRYYRIDTPAVAAMLEALMVFGSARAGVRPTSAASPEREARTCYDHLAGRLGVALLDRLRALGFLCDTAGNAALTSSGRVCIEGLGIDTRALPRGRRALVRPCLDWSERRDHLGGSLGAALLDHFLEDRWLLRCPGSRALTVTPKGKRRLRETFGLEMQGLPRPA